MGARHANEPYRSANLSFCCRAANTESTKSAQGLHLRSASRTHVNQSTLNTRRRRRTRFAPWNIALLIYDGGESSLGAPNETSGALIKSSDHCSAQG